MSICHWNQIPIMVMIHSPPQYKLDALPAMHLNESSGAYFLCICVGFCDGALLVPFKLSSNGITDSDGILEVFRYLASFGISSILVSPILFFFYCLFINQRRVPCFYFRSAFLPGVSSGVLWAAANFLSVHATYYLGNLRTCLSSGKYSRIRLNVWHLFSSRNNLFSFWYYYHTVFYCLVKV